MSIYGYVCVSLCIYDCNISLKKKMWGIQASLHLCPRDPPGDAVKKDGLHLWRAIPRDVRRGAVGGGFLCVSVIPVFKWSEKQSDHCFNEVTIVPQKKGFIFFG